MIRLIALDLDQTLMSSNLVISQRVHNAVASAKQKGVKISIITGRGLRVTSRYASELGLQSPVVCYQGGLIFDLEANKMLNEVRLPSNLIPSIISIAEQYSWNLHFEADSHIYLPKNSDHSVEFFDLIRLVPWSRVDNLLTDLPAVPHKFLVNLKHPDDRQQTLAEMNSAFHNLISIVPSHPILIEGLPSGVDKGRGLEWLAGYLGTPREEVMAIGDNDNDVPMIAWAGIGVAMGNCSTSACEVADWIAPPVEEDGAAVAIEKFVLS